MYVWFGGCLVLMKFWFRANHEQSITVVVAIYRFLKQLLAELLLDVLSTVKTQGLGFCVGG